MSASTVSHHENNSSPEISVWCSHFNTTDKQQANVVALDGNSFILYADKPFHEGTPLFVRVRSFPRAAADRPIEIPVRTVSIMEVKWCRRTDETTNQRAYEMGVSYLHPYD